MGGEKRTALLLAQMPSYSISDLPILNVAQDIQDLLIHLSLPSYLRAVHVQECSSSSKKKKKKKLMDVYGARNSNIPHTSIPVSTVILFVTCYCGSQKLLLLPKK